MPDAFAPDPARPLTVPLFAGAALLDAEKLDCYRLALEFQALAAARWEPRPSSLALNTVRLFHDDPDHYLVL